jgi:hypothetical protein
VTLDAADLDAGWQHAFITKTLELVPGIDYNYECSRAATRARPCLWGLWMGADASTEQSFA